MLPIDIMYWQWCCYSSNNKCVDDELTIAVYTRWERQWYYSARLVGFCAADPCNGHICWMLLQTKRLTRSGGDKWELRSGIDESSHVVTDAAVASTQLVIPLSKCVAMVIGAVGCKLVEVAVPDVDGWTMDGGGAVCGIVVALDVFELTCNNEWCRRRDSLHLHFDFQA